MIKVQNNTSKKKRRRCTSNHLDIFHDENGNELINAPNEDIDQQLSMPLQMSSHRMMYSHVQPIMMNQSWAKQNQNFMQPTKQDV